MVTPVDERKHKTYEPLLEDGKPMRRVITEITPDEFILSKPIVIGDISYESLPCHSREEEMFEALAPCVLVEIGIHDKKPRVNRIIPAEWAGKNIVRVYEDDAIITPVGLEAETATGYTDEIDPVTGEPRKPRIDDMVSYRGKTIEIPNGNTNVNNGDTGIVRWFSEPDEVEVHFFVQPNDDTVVVSADDLKHIRPAQPVSQPVAVEGTDKDAPGVDVAAYDKRIQDLATLNAELIAKLDKAESRVIELERAQAAQSEAADDSPLVTTPAQRLYEQVFIADISAAELQRGYDEKWQFVHYHVSETPKSLSVVVIRPKPTNGTPKPTMIEVATPTPPVATAQDKRVVIGVIETPAVVMNADAEQQTVATEKAVEDMREVYKPGKQKPAVGLPHLGKFHPTTAVRIGGKS